MGRCCRLKYFFIFYLMHRTLYCAKNNYEFGLSRIAHALDGGVGPRLCADTWLHVKRCVLGLLTAFAKQAVVLPSVAIMEVLNFLHTCEGIIFFYRLFIALTKDSSFGFGFNAQIIQLVPTNWFFFWIFALVAS